MKNFNWELFWKFILVITTLFFMVEVILFTFFKYSDLTMYVINGTLTIISSMILIFYKFKK